jgi:hypothetical protein
MVGASVGASVAGISVAGGGVAAGGSVGEGPQAARTMEAMINATIARYSFFMYFFSSLRFETDI